VLDPFAGTGTTLLAGLAACRSSLGVEIDPSLCAMFTGRAARMVSGLNDFILDRLKAHLEFAREQEKRDTPLAYTNSRYGFAVKTRQETDLFIPCLSAVEITGPCSMNATYADDAFLRQGPRPLLTSPLQSPNQSHGSVPRIPGTGA
jgi:hypothetical protein